MPTEIFRLFWLGPWTDRIGDTVENALGQAVDELIADLRSLSGIRELDLAKGYDLAINRLDARKPESQGLGHEDVAARELPCRSIRPLPAVCSHGTRCKQPRLRHPILSERWLAPS